jgi:hypothetical protein
VYSFKGVVFHDGVRIAHKMFLRSLKTNFASPCSMRKKIDVRGALLGLRSVQTGQRKPPTRYRIMTTSRTSRRPEASAGQ